MSSYIEEELSLTGILKGLGEPEAERKVKFIQKVTILLEDGSIDLKKLKETATKKDFNKIVKILLDKEALLEERVLVAIILASIGNVKHAKILEDELSKRETPEVSHWIFLGLMSPKGIFPIEPRLRLIFDTLKQMIEAKGLTPEWMEALEREIMAKGLTPELMDQLDSESYRLESGINRFEEDVFANLRELSSNNDYKMEFAKYRVYLNELLIEHLTIGFSIANLNFDVAVNVCQILDGIGLRRDILENIRPALDNRRCVYLAGKYGEPDFVRDLARQLATEDMYEDPFAWASYRNVVIEALSDLGRRFSSEEKYEVELGEAVEPLTRMLCEHIDDDEVLSLNLLRAIENVQGNGKTADFVVSKIMEAPDLTKCGYLKVLVLLRDKPTAFEKLEDHFLKGSLDERRKAEQAIGQMGLSQAVDLLVTTQLTGLYSEYIAKPIHEVEKMSLEILRRTVTKVENTCTVNTGMSVTVFAVGVFVVIMGAILAITGTNDPTQLWVGTGSIIGGILTTLITFAKGPINIVQSALADLAQVETAFLYNVRSTGLASFAFLKEYLKEGKPDMNILENCTAKMNEVAKDTMLLIELYGGGNDTLKDLIKEKKDELIKAIMKPSNEEKRTAANAQNRTKTTSPEQPTATDSQNTPENPK